MSSYMTPEEALVMATFAASMPLEDWEMFDEDIDDIQEAFIDALDARLPGTG